MTDQEAKLLLLKYEDNLCSREEKALVESWYLNLSAHTEDLTNEPDYAFWNNYIKKDLPLQEALPVSVKRLWPRVAAVAAAVAAMAIGIYFFSAPHSSESNLKLHSGLYANDISPGRNTAILMLASGRTIQLSDAKRGVVIAKNKIVYSDGSPLVSSSGKIQTLTAATPRGGTYQIMLPDGTRVWMNADSKISFPSQFTGKKRKIQLSGEAYLEVAKDKAHPFIVVADQQELEVLGTHFNINSYADEPDIKTTLLEGSVRISLLQSSSMSLRAGTKGKSQSGETILKPNQQSAVTGTGSIMVKTIDPNDVIAWKNGLFVFESAGIEEIMKVLARWYNIEVIYKGQIPDDRFGINVSRFDKVSTVLKMLEKTEAVRFEIQGRNVTVMKK